MDAFIIIGIIIAMVVFLGFLFGLAMWLVAKEAHEDADRERDNYMNG